MTLHHIALAAIAAGALAASAEGLRADESSLAYSHDLEKQGGRLCMSNHAHSGFGTGATKASARTAAIRSWADFTNLEYGSIWASYSVSGGQKTAYTKEATGWGATVEGRPCKR